MFPRGSVALAALLLTSGCPDVIRVGPDSGTEDAGRAAPDAGDEPDDGGSPPPQDAGPRPDAGGDADAGEAADAGTGGDAGSGGGLDGGPSPDSGAPVSDAGAADAGPIAQPFDVTWIHGASNCATSADPPLQTWAYDDDTVILRQSKCVNFEGPFLYLLFGSDKALLLDTGATASAAAFPVRDTVEGLITSHLAGAPRSSVELVVAHTHAHGDHVQGDGQFSGQPDTTLVNAARADVEAFFGITSWPTDVVSYDLGGRVLDVLPIPGHEANHIAVYDRQTGLLLTGDTVYPGYIFIQQWNTFRASIGRLADFVADRPVTWVLGTHVEMKATPGEAYPYGTTWQPDEHVLQLTRQNLLDLDTTLQALGATPTAYVFDDFILSP